MSKDRFKELIDQLENKYHCQILLEKKIISSGAIQVTAYANRKYIQHIKLAIIPKDILDNIPFTEDYRANNPPCAVCGKRGTELHHWAPQHLFEDANNWPQSYLCREHHLLWHSRIMEHSNNGHKPTN